MGPLWNIDQIFKNPIYISAICIFFACLFAAIIILVLMSIYKRILQTAAKTIDLIDDLKKSPLKYRLMRISMIFDETGSFEKELMIWRTKYEILFEIEMQKVFRDFVALIEDKKNTRPSLNNLKKFQAVYQKTMTINKSVHEIFIETMNNLEIEFIQRDSLTFQKELFRILKDEVIMTTFKDIAIDQDKLKDTIDQIESLFEEFYFKLDEGRYKESWDYLLKIDQALIFLIELLDSIPYVISTITTVIPQMMTELKNKHITFGPVRKNLHLNAMKYGELENYIDNLRIKINNELQKLQFKKANRTLKEVFNQINSFKSAVENEDNLKSFFEVKTPSIRNKFDMIEHSSRLLERDFTRIEDITKQFSKERNDFEIAKAAFRKTKAKADLLFSQIDLGTNNGEEINLFEIKTEMLKLMEQSLKDMSALEKSAKIVESKSTNIDSLVNQVIFIQSILNQLDVKINQFKSIYELERFIDSIQELHLRLLKYSRENLQKITTQEEKERISNQIEICNQDTLILARDLNDTIFLDYISQEIIVYLERYVGKVEGIEQVIYNCEKLFKERELDQLIGYSLQILMKLKENRIR
ncbi:septation ring formation regulator EzrA [Spiroplasma floricola]|uniref:Septation ring formation regulator n=1 Tax=Spiroplasma floricola 23-6 TaxID=1336749 RepID=A0A2K8SET5_9MOLU|nr:septation ring formation regulator EzrA [Spiroplasma floricola]AUB31977.1 septation ring formation regulator [Spiroplasma floricola 23-6]